MKAGLLTIGIALALAGCNQAGTTANNQAVAAPANGSINGAADANGQASAATGITPAEVAAMIERDGARATVQALDQGETNNRFYAVLEGVSAGEQAWLDLVPRLGPGTDAGATTGLEIAVAEALARNAAGVLRIAGTSHSVQDICSYPMIEPTPEQTRSYFAAAIPAVEAISDPALQEKKTECLRLLRAAQTQAGGQ